MLKIVRLETFVIGDGPEIDPDKGGIEPLACLQVRTDDGLTGFSEVFRVPPGVVQATVGGPETHFGRLLIGQEITHPERLWQHVWDSLIHTNRRGWEIIILGAGRCTLGHLRAVARPAGVAVARRSAARAVSNALRNAINACRAVLHAGLRRVGWRGDDRPTG